jgi:VWA domain-containing protein
VRTRARLRRLVGSPTAIDTHDLGRFRSIVRRTGIVRLVLAGGALALVLAAAAAAREPQTSERTLVPPDRIGVVVVDLSLSITDGDLAVIRQTFRRLVAEKASVGLVVFSDTPYEMLPPGTPAAELRPILRLLVPPRLGPIRTPWNQTFRAGTRISVALELAKSALERDEIASGSILIVSDLESAPDDVPALARTIDGLNRAGIKLRIVALAPSSDAVALFSGLLEDDAVSAFTQQGGSGGDQPEAAPTGVDPPVVFLALGLLVFGLLAAHERFSGRIALPRAKQTVGRAS